MPSRILITGLNGFLAVPTALKFLREGWIVRGTVRSSSKAESTQNLSSLKEYVSNGKLEVVVVEDLSNDDLSQVLEGVDAVAHLAAPFQFNLGSWAEHRNGAVRNTLHVLQEVNKASGVKSFMLLSSLAAIIEGDKPYKDFAGVVYNEDMWYSATEEQCESLDESDPISAVIWYCASKKFQELAALDFVKKEKPSWKFLVLNPSLILGASLEVDTPEQLEEAAGVSTQILRGSLLSKGGPVPGTQFPTWVDVRDVVTGSYEGIVRGLEGRIILNGGINDNTQPVRSALKQFPELKDLVANADLNHPSPVEAGGCFEVDTTKSQRVLGLKYFTFDEMVADVVRRYKEIGAL